MPLVCELGYVPSRNHRRLAFFVLLIFIFIFILIFLVFIIVVIGISRRRRDAGWGSAE
jgi:hypothetical protein